MLMRAPQGTPETTRGHKIGRAVFGTAAVAVLAVTGVAWWNGTAHAEPCHEGFCDDHPRIDVFPPLHVLLPTGSS